MPDSYIKDKRSYKYKSEVTHAQKFTSSKGYEKC